MRRLDLLLYPLWLQFVNFESTYERIKQYAIKDRLLNHLKPADVNQTNHNRVSQYNDSGLDREKGVQSGCSTQVVVVKRG